MREAVENETCPISTEGWTRRVQLVWEGGGLLLLRAAPLAAARGAPRPPLSAAPPRAGNGNEKNLELCPHGPWARVDCDHSMDAGVCCQVPFPPPPPHPALCRTVRARPHNRRCARARAWPGALRSGRFSRPGSCLCGRGRGCEPRAPLLFRTKWTRLVHPSVLIGHDILPRQGKKERRGEGRSSCARTAMPGGGEGPWDGGHREEGGERVVRGEPDDLRRKLPFIYGRRFGAASRTRRGACGGHGRGAAAGTLEPSVSSPS